MDTKIRGWVAHDRGKPKDLRTPKIVSTSPPRHIGVAPVIGRTSRLTCRPRSRIPWSA